MKKSHEAAPLYAEQNSLLNQDRFWIFLFATYYITHIVIRLVTGDALGLDEAEILLQGQDLSWGYGPQLPLYAWLQWSMFQITGVTIFGLSFLKNTLLFLTVLLIHLTLRSEYSSKASGLAALSLLLLPQISWEAQRDLTHSVLVNFMSVLTFSFIWFLSHKKKLYLYLILAIIIACGALSKYNYGIVFLSIVMASLLNNETRRALLSPLFVVSLLITAILIWQPISWIVHHPDIAFLNARKLGMVENSSHLISLFKGLLSLFMAAVSFIAPLVIVALGLMSFYRKDALEVRSSPLIKNMMWVMAASILIMIFFIFYSHSTNIKDRWLQPMLIFMGPVVFLWLYPRLSSKGELRYVQVCFIIAATIVTMMVPYSMSTRSYRSAPFRDIALQIKAAIPPNSSILATTWIAGNLLYVEPHLDVIATEVSAADVKADFLIWNADEKPRRKVDQLSVKTFEAPYKFDESKTLGIAIARIIE